ncbi:hypothetical protein HHI36_013249 [Cryptolaemus montrouzieri]|uniref:Uncharacterized protein n=1 Tax=Cryptolaemus montrouzieri TaxID=559131 RepID=A0ABD2NGK9_9CUCU
MMEVVYFAEIPDGTDLLPYAINSLSKPLQIDVFEQNVSNIYREKTDTFEFITIKFIAQVFKGKILKKAHLLEGTRVAIAQDRTVAEGINYKIPKKYLDANCSDPKNKCYMKGKLPYVNKSKFSAEELRQLESSDVPVGKSGSEVPVELSACSNNRAGGNETHLSNSKKNNNSGTVDLISLSQSGRRYPPDEMQQTEMIKGYRKKTL